MALGSPGQCGKQASAGALAEKGGGDVVLEVCSPSLLSTDNKSFGRPQQNSVL